jgi:hypothetical protein
MVAAASREQNFSIWNLEGDYMVFLQSKQD